MMGEASVLPFLSLGVLVIICLLCLLLVVGVWRALETRLHRQYLGLFAEALDAYTRETLERLDWLRAQTPPAASPWPVETNGQAHREEEYR